MSTSTLTRPVEHVHGYLVVPAPDGVWFDVLTEDHEPVVPAVRFNRHELAEAAVKVAAER